VKSIVAQFPSESAVSVPESQSAFRDPKVACSIACIRSNFGRLPDGIKRLETQGFPLQESMDIMKRGSRKLSVVKGEAGKSFQVAGGVKKKPWIFDIYRCWAGT
jgi:hypothetical protein